MKVFCFPVQYRLHRLCATLTILLLFVAASMPVAVSAQSAPLQFTPIPYSAPDIISPGRGAEQWENGSESVNYPFADSNYRSFDVYARFPWTRLEDSVAGKYNWTYFDNLIMEAIDNGQKLSFGIMPVYDGEGTVVYDGAKSAYPLYLHKAMSTSTASVRDWVSNGVWIPNWNHGYYLARLRALHIALNAHILKSSYKGVAYKDAIYCIDVRGYGNYGEWHNAGIVEHVKDYPSGRKASVFTLKTIIDCHTQVFTQWPLVLMIAAFDAEQYDAIMTPAEVTYYALTTRNAWGPLGWRRDQWGATDPYLDKLLKHNEKKYGSSALFKDLITKRYITSPVTGEPPRYISPGGSCDYWDLENQLATYGATSLGNGNWGKKLIGCGQDNARAAFKRAGYRIILQSGNISNIISAGKPFTIRLDWKNIGIAPTYENWDVFFELKNDSNRVVWTSMSSFKPKHFPPAPDSTAVLETFVLPADVSIGNYKLNLVIKDPARYRQPLPLAIEGRNSDGSYTLKEIFVSPGVCTPPVASIKSVPACDGQPASLILDSATGTVPYSIVINDSTYNGIMPGQIITHVTSHAQNIWQANPSPSGNIDSPVELGLKFKTKVPGHVTGIRFFSPDLPGGVYTGRLWTSSGRILDSATFNNVTPSSWQEVYFSKPIAIHADSTYIVSYHTTSGLYASTPAGLKSNIESGPFIVEGETGGNGNGVYAYGAAGSFPMYSFNASNYWADVIFESRIISFTLTGITDINNCNNAGLSQTINVDLKNRCDTLPGDTVSTPALDATLTHTSACRGENFNLILDSANGTGPYDLVINGITYPGISVGETITEIRPAVQKAFNEIPATNSYIDAPVELGMKFKTSINGKINGIRFFSSNEASGTFTGHLWTTTGILLDSTVFENVKPNSWQEAFFENPVEIRSDSVYIVSYHSRGHYAATPGGLQKSFTSGYITVPADSLAAGNGLYAYGQSGTFPTNSYNSANYWADVLFAPDTTFTYTFELTSITDQAGHVKTGALQTLSIVTSNDCDTIPVGEEPTATLGYSADCSTQSFTLVLDSADGVAPYDLVINGQLYSNLMPGQTITTISAPVQSIWNIIPSVISAEDQPVELGVKFKASVNGYVKGIRFFSPANAAGTYTGHLWSASGQMLQSAVFKNVAAGAWQEILFATPQWVTADSVYVASYHTSAGHYAATTGGLSTSIVSGHLTALGDSIAGGNGVYRYGTEGVFPDMTYNANNYWVDVLFAADTSYTYTFDLTRITDNSGSTKSGDLHSLSITTTGCADAPVSTQSRGAVQMKTSPVVDRQIHEESLVYDLEQNFPNPFHTHTTIRYSVPKAGKVTLALYDINGRLINVLVNGWKEPGRYSIGVNRSLLPGGLYFYKMQASDYSAVKKLVVQ